MSQTTKSVVIKFVAVCIIASLPLGARASEQRTFWPDGFSGAVSLTFDDGMPTQLENAIPLLDRYGIKASFYVNPNYSIDWEKNIPAWSRVVDRGHELGNHTDRHTCSCRHTFGNNSSFCLERIKLADIAGVIDAGSVALKKTFTGSLVDRSFAYPCYESFVGEGTGRRSYVPEVAMRYRTARAGDHRSNAPLTANLAYLGSYSVDERTYEQTATFIEREIAKGRWVILTFHGVSGDWLSVDAVYLERILRLLQLNSKRIWTAPLFTISQYIERRRETHPLRRQN